MTLFEKNLKTLQSHHPDLARRIGEVDAERIPTSEEPEIRAFWSPKKIRNPLILIFYGLGSGQHLLHYLENPHPKNRAILVLEKRLGVFKKILETVDLSLALAAPHISWLIGEDPIFCRTFFQAYFLQRDFLSFSSGIENIFWTPSLIQDGPYYVSVAKTLAEGSGDSLLAMIAKPEDAFRGLINILGNIDLLSRHEIFDSLKNAYAGKPGLVISTGPSLNKTLPYLTTLLQDQVVLFAVDSAVPVLLKAGIQPHFIACLERVVATRKRFEELPPLPNTTLVALPVVSPDTLKIWKEKNASLSFLFPKSMRWNWLMDSVPTHYVGPSASTMAFSCLDILGCDPIFLVGQDCAFDRASGRSHALGAAEFIQEVGVQKREEVEEQLKKNHSENLVMGNDGTPILSWEPYRVTAQAIENMIVERKKLGKTCINVIPASYGMRLAEAQHREPSEAFQKICEEPVFQISDNSPQPPLHLRGGEERVMLLSLKDRLEATRESMKRLSFLSLKKLEELSEFQLEYPPDPLTPDIEAAYEKECLRRYREIKDLQEKEPSLRAFLWPFVMLADAVLFMKYHDLEGREDSFKNRLEPMFGIFESWYREIFHWSERTGWLMRQKK